MAASDAIGNARTYGNWRKPRSAGLFGLGSLGTGLLFFGLIVALLASLAGGWQRGLIVLVVVGALMGLVLTRDRHGKSLLERGQTRMAWALTKQRGAHLYRSGPLGYSPWGTYQLPGVAAPLKLREHEDAYSRPFALIECPSTSTYAAVIATQPDGASLVDQEQVDIWVAHWGHWLAQLADEPGLIGAAVTIETAPDTGHELRREVEGMVDSDAPIFARQVLEDVVTMAPNGSNVVRGFVTLTFSSIGAGGKKRTAEEVGRELSTRLPGLTADLSATGAGASRPVAAAELCEVIRTAYNPSAAILIDEAHAQQEETDLSWNDVGPSASESAWDHYRHEDAYSRSWSMTVAPRGNVQSNVLTRLLAPRHEVARKRITLLYRPIDPAVAAALVENDLRSAQFVATAEKVPTARSMQGARSAAATANEEASGAGLVNFGMVVTATVTDAADMAEANAAIDNLGASARLQLRTVYGAQAAAFAAGLPLGLVIPKHLQLQAAMDRL